MWQFVSRVSLQHALAVFFCLSSTATALACQVCLEAARALLTIGGQLDVADRVVLAAATGPTQFRVVAVVKGGNAVGDNVTDPVTDLDALAPTEHDPWLLLRDGLAPQWTALGAINAQYADWLRQLASLDRGEAGWRRRIALVLPYLEAPDPLAAQIAAGEVARAPYTTLDAAKSRVDPKLLEGWLDHPWHASRHTPYTLLLGFAGGASDADHIERRIDKARQAHDAANLAAMLTADLQLRGPDRVGWLERAYFTDRSRSMAEIEAALLALKVHDDTNAAVPRERVIQAYRMFIRQRPAMAGFVAQELAEWGYWDAAPEYAALLSTDTIKDAASEFAVSVYLRRAADAAAARKSVFRLTGTGD
jgi:hypothetical protein